MAPQQCSCVEGWTGSSCDIGEHTPCSVHVVDPYDNTPPPPSAVCSPNCVNGGSCVAPNNCTCPPGWTGATCSQGAWGSKVHRWGVLRVSFFFLSAATCSPPCQNGGSCISPDSCVCTQGWTRPDCSHRMSKGHHMMSHTMHLFLAMHIHPPPPHPTPAAVCSVPCLNGGHCSAPDRCTCSTGWEGQSCSTCKGEGLRRTDRPSP